MPQIGALPPQRGVAFPYELSASDDEETLDAVRMPALDENRGKCDKAKEMIAKLPDNRQSDSRAHWSILNPKCGNEPWSGFNVRNG